MSFIQLLLSKFHLKFYFSVVSTINPLLTKDRRCNKGTLWIGMADSVSRSEG